MSANALRREDQRTHPVKISCTAVHVIATHELRYVSLLTLALTAGREAKLAELVNPRDHRVSARRM